MTLKSRISMSAALLTGMLVLASTAAAGGVTGYRDAGERASLSSDVQATISGYRDAHQRTQLFKPALSTGVGGYLDAGDRSQAGKSIVPARLNGYVDAAERGGLAPQSSPNLAGSLSGTGFDWADAAVGASSALVLALLVGVSLVTVRRFRAGPLAH